MPLLASTWPFLVTILFISLLSVFTWRQPARPGKRYFSLLMLVWLVWSVAACLEAVTASVMARFILVQLEVLCVQVGGVLELLFALEYTGQQRWLTRWLVALLFLAVALGAVLLLTNPIHHLVWSEFLPGGDIIARRGPLMWALILFHFGLWLANLTLLVRCMVRSPAFTAPILLLLVAQFVPRLAFLLVSPAGSAWSPVQLAVLFSNFSALVYFLVLFNYGLLQVAPVGRDVAFDYVAYSLLVLDAEDRLVDFNPAAAALLKLPGRAALGVPASRLLGDWWPRLALYIGQPAEVQELAVQIGGEARVFNLYSQPLLHASGWRTGQVFVLNDITPAWRQRRLQAQQQWAQATLQEREQLAYELHDGLSQNLAFLNLQAQAAQAYLLTGHTQPAQASLERLVDVALQMQGDTRELIANLMTVSLPAQDFCSTLRQVLLGFENRASLPVLLDVAGDVETICRPDGLDPAAAVQILRIIQEALINVRKHARRPSQVVVRLSLDEQTFQALVSDNGIGFDPAAVQAEEGSRHFGLKIMRQRAEVIGGELAIHSAPGQGATLALSAPAGRVRIKA